MVRPAYLAPVGDLALIDGDQLLVGQVGNGIGLVADKDQPVAAIELHLHLDALLGQVVLLLLGGRGQQGQIGLTVGDIQPGVVGGRAQRFASRITIIFHKEVIQRGGDRLAGGRAVQDGEIALGKKLPLGIRCV